MLDLFFLKELSEEYFSDNADTNSGLDSIEQKEEGDKILKALTELA